MSAFMGPKKIGGPRLQPNSPMFRRALKAITIYLIPIGLLMKQPFDLNITCTTDNFKIYVNDQVLILLNINIIYYKKYIQ